MLPDDYENLAESVVASSAFANNILSAITTKDYWNISNNYKPLMHLWYIGVLMQAYIVLPLCFKLLDKVSGKVLKIGAIILFAISFALYLVPVFSEASKFYYLPFRAFELLAGAIVCFLPKLKTGSVLSKLFSVITIIGIVALTIIDTGISDKVYLIGVVLLSVCLLELLVSTECKSYKILKWGSVIGTASLSVYIIHQPVIAFTRYLFTADITGWTLLIVIGITAALSFGMRKIEKFSIAWSKSEKVIRPFIVSVIMTGAVCTAGLYVYMKAGVMRDIPELDIYASTAKRGMHAEYVDIPYSFDKDFTSSDRIHILVVGDSMGRDWCNILNESQYSDNYEISYIYTPNVSDKNANRFEEADYIFYASLGDARVISNEILTEFSTSDKFYVVGIKNFGECNGQIFRRRNTEDYFESSITLGRTNKLDMTFEEQNELQKEFYGDKYIDMIEAIRNDDGSIPVFTDTNKYISADTEHLTQAGAQYYSRILDLSWIE